MRLTNYMTVLRFPSRRTAASFGKGVSPRVQERINHYNQHVPPWGLGEIMFEVGDILEGEGDPDIAKYYEDWSQQEIQELYDWLKSKSEIP